MHKKVMLEIMWLSMFEETGTYHIQIHVEDNEDLHEHVEYEVSVKE